MHDRAVPGIELSTFTPGATTSGLTRKSTSVGPWLEKPAMMLLVARSGSRSCTAPIVVALDRPLAVSVTPSCSRRPCTPGIVGWFGVPSCAHRDRSDRRRCYDEHRDRARVLRVADLRRERARARARSARSCPRGCRRESRAASRGRSRARRPAAPLRPRRTVAKSPAAARERGPADGDGDTDEVADRDWHPPSARAPPRRATRPC